MLSAADVVVAWYSFCFSESGGSGLFQPQKQNQTNYSTLLTMANISKWERVRESEIERDGEREKENEKEQKLPTINRITRSNDQTLSLASILSQTTSRNSLQWYYFPVVASQISATESSTPVWILLEFMLHTFFSVFF